MLITNIPSLWEPLKENGPEFRHLPVFCNRQGNYQGTLSIIHYEGRYKENGPNVLGILKLAQLGRK